MNNVYILIPVADPSVQNFDQLVNELSGGYLPEDHTKVSFVDGEEVEEIVENPYKGFVSPDYSDKILLVSHTAYSAPEGAQNIVVEGELNLPRLWNAGISHAANQGATHIVILNEVSSINPHIFDKAINENDTDIINISDGGAFIVKPTVSANESFRWWFADLDLFSRYDVALYREEFIDIKQSNAIPIDENMQEIVNADSATYSQ